MGFTCPKQFLLSDTHKPNWKCVLDYFLSLELFKFSEFTSISLGNCKKQDVCYKMFDYFPIFFYLSRDNYINKSYLSEAESGQVGQVVSTPLLNIWKLWGLFLISLNYPKCKLICTSVNFDLYKSLQCQIMVVESN